MRNCGIAIPTQASGKSALEAVQLSKRLKDGVKAKAMEQMKRISAKFESEWMKKSLSSNIHPIFGMLQQKDPLDKLEHFLTTNDVSRQLTDKMETPLHVLFRPDSKCTDFQKIIKTIMLLMKNADLSQASTNLWGRTVMDYIKYYSNLSKGEKEQLITQLNHDKASSVGWQYFYFGRINLLTYIGAGRGATPGRKGKQRKKNEKLTRSKSETGLCTSWLPS